MNTAGFCTPRTFGLKKKLGCSLLRISSLKGGLKLLQKCQDLMLADPEDEMKAWMACHAWSQSVPEAAGGCFSFFSRWVTSSKSSAARCDFHNF